jgi:magnesium transporter
MQTRYQHGALVWVDLESPTRDEVHTLAGEFDINPLVADELLLPATKPRAEAHGNYMYLVLHFPALRHTHKSREQEIDFIVGQHFVITTRYDTVDPLHKFSKIFEVNSLLDKSAIGDHAGYLFYYMLKKLYKSVEHEIDYIRKEIETIDEHLFSEQEVEMVLAISRSSRDLLNVRQTIEPHREILHELEEIGPKFFGDAYATYTRALSNEYYRVHNHVMRNTESLHELRETNNTLLTTKQNETMKVFTILAFFTFPLSLIAAIFSTDAVHEPIVGSPFDFWKIIGIMLVAAIIMMWYFRSKKWF